MHIINMRALAMGQNNRPALLDRGQISETIKHTRIRAGFP